MALKLTDRLKNINLTESVGVITESVKGAFEQKQKIENNPESAESVIDSVDSLNGYLASLQAEASPAVVMALQSQMQVLKYIQSPTMALMVVDNLMLSLHKALKEAESDQQKEVLRECFASLLQSFIFVLEARLRYEIDNNKDETFRLLADAGDMLISSVGSTAMMVVPMAAGVKMGHTLPKMVNVLAAQNEQRSFLGRLILAKGKKAVIEEKKAEFDKTLNYIFDTLDSYAELVGPSILIHGMLKRYADGLVERYSIAQYASVEKMINESEVEGLEGLTQIRMPSKPEVVGLKMLLSMLTQTTKTPSTLDYESLRNIRRSLQSKLSGIEAQIAKIDNEIENIKAEINELSILRHNRKEALKLQIDQLVLDRGVYESSAMEYQQRICVVADIITPAEARIEEYTLKMQRIVGKYEALLDI